jgi:hypothetical protein
MVESPLSINLSYHQMYQLFGIDIQRLNKDYGLISPKDFLNICNNILQQYVSIFTDNGNENVTMNQFRMTRRQHESPKPKKDSSPFLVN